MTQSPASDIAGIKDPLRRWLRDLLPPGNDAEITSLRVPSAGYSAKTLMAEIEYRENNAVRQRNLVIRLDQPGHHIFLDTSMARQGEMMRALVRNHVPAPTVLGIETDPSILGGPFLVMDEIKARFLQQNPSYHTHGYLTELSPAQRKQLWLSAVETIARVNRLPWRPDFQFLNKPQFGPPGLDQYLNWLVAWKTEASGGGPHPTLDPAIDYLLSSKPDIPHVNVIWGDSNVGNMMFNDARVAAALDFEAAALGPAEIDFGWWLFVDEMLSLGVERSPGLPDRTEQLAVYEETLGRKIADTFYFEVLAAVKMSLVLVRSVERFINYGMLPAGHAAALRNPVVRIVAQKLDLPYQDDGAAYMELVAAMNQR